MPYDKSGQITFITLRWEITSSYEKQVHCTMWNNKINICQIVVTSIDNIFFN